MIGAAVITYNREHEFHQVVNSVKGVDYLVAVKDFGAPRYGTDPMCDYYQMRENVGVGACKNLAIDALLGRGCDHIFLLEDDCLVLDKKVWSYAISFSEESGLLHFNWDNCVHPIVRQVYFPKNTSNISHDTSGAFGYFHKNFLTDVRFDPYYINSWEHIDVMMEGHRQGFLPPFRNFVSPANLEKYLRVIDGGRTSMTSMGKSEDHADKIERGHDHFISKWGDILTTTKMISEEELYEIMKEISAKYSNRTRLNG